MYQKQRLFRAALAICLVVAALPASAHETDQYTMPKGREFADLGDYLTKYMYDAVVGGVEKQNARIRRGMEAKEKGKTLEGLLSPDEIALSVNRRFPVALVLIDRLDGMSLSADTKAHYPGRVVGFKNGSGLRRYVDLPLNPFNAWSCATIEASGVYTGTDKIGHFSDMGMHYYTAFRAAKRDGASEEQALKKMLVLGTEDPVYSERGLLGLATAGAYSNADLVSNYMGFCFYRNLTEPVMLKGEMRPPMLVKDGDYWRVADHVKPDSDFFSWFISDHLNEALNPSLYRDDMRDRIRKSIRENRKLVLQRYTDPNGNCWSQERFKHETEELFTYWGVDYGHWGGSALMTVDTTCFAPPPDMNSATARNDDGLSAMHVAAARNDLATMQKLADNGADVNARVETTINAPAVNGDTPLHLAAKDGQLEAVQWLLARGADVNAKNDRGDTPLHMAVEFPRVADGLIRGGANVDVATASGRTPLHWAARDPLASAGLKLLLDHGAKPEPLDRDGQTPLHDAARAAHADAIVALIRGGADVNAADHFGITPLHLAAADANPAVCDLFVRAGANPNARDDFGCTPLFAATRKSRGENVATLLSRGANPAVTDSYGRTALAVANEGHHETIAQILGTRAEPQTAGARIAPSTPHAVSATQIPLSNAR